MNSPRHHPGGQILADYLAGECSPGTGLLIASHVEACSRCQCRLMQMGVAHAPPRRSPQDPEFTLSAELELIPVTEAGGLGEAVYMMRVAPGASISPAGSLALCEILVLTGALTVSGQTFRAHDFAVLQLNPERLVADPEIGFTALVTAEQADVARSAEG